MQKTCRKMGLCKMFERGFCEKASEKCRFAHGAEDLLAKPELQGTKLCPVVQQGAECTRRGCKYAHSSEELKVPAVQPVEIRAPKPVQPVEMRAPKPVRTWRPSAPACTMVAALRRRMRRCANRP